MPNDDTDVIWFGLTRCTETSNDGSTITCTLDDTRVSGNWLVDILTVHGLTPTTVTTNINVPVSVSSITPNVDVNYLGGNVMTITGDSFGYDKHAIKVSYADGTSCDILSVTMTQITCENRRFTSGAESVQDVIIEINGESASPVSVTLLEQAEISVSIEPNSVSPVLKTDITVYLDPNYPETLVKADFEAVLYSNDDPAYKRVLFIVSVDDEEKSMVIKFPGAVSGSYWIMLTSTQFGRIDTDLLQLAVHGTVTSVSPLTGSKYGGTLITILGENFSHEPLDNPVMIGDEYCYVKTSSPTKITCRTDLLVENKVGDQTLLVFLKTSEEAATPNGEDIIFTYAYPTAELADLEVTFDANTFSHKVIVSGTGFDDSTQLFIDEVEQVLDYADGTNAVFFLNGIKEVSSTDIQIFTADGLPEGAEIEHFIEAVPALLMLDPPVGSAGGTKVLVTGSGFGEETENLNILVGDTEICAEVKVTSYGHFTCTTKAMEIPAGQNVTITIDGTANAESFVASDVSYSQESTIHVTGVSLSGNAVTFTGSGFLTDHTGKCKIEGVEADSVVINSETEAVATFLTSGVPATQTVPVLKFENAAGYQLFAANDAAITFEKSITVTGSSAGVDCSFAGGCQYSINSEGLLGTLKKKENSVHVCGVKCDVDADASSSSQVTCNVPPLATTHSIDNYKISKADVLMEEIFPEGTEHLHDSSTIDSYITKNKECYFGMNFRDGHVAILDEAKVFIGFLLDKKPYVNKLAFQGSNDNWSTWEELHLFGEEIHEGWNYIDYRDDGVEKPAFNSYRFFGSGVGACKVTEFKLHGVQAIADESATHECPV